MTQTFVHLPVDRVIFGAGSLSELPQAVERLGVKRAFIITGRTLATKTEWISRVQGLLGGRCAGVYGEASQHVPKRTILDAAAQARDAQADGLVSVGGGSPIDTAKGAALCLAEEIRDEAGLNRYATPHRLAESEPFQVNRPVPQIAIPTTLSAGEHTEIGRASCRERGENSVVAVTLKKNT